MAKRGEKGLVSTYSSPSLREVRAETQIQQALGGRQERMPRPQRDLEHFFTFYCDVPASVGCNTKYKLVDRAKRDLFVTVQKGIKSKIEMLTW